MNTDRRDKIQHYYERSLSSTLDESLLKLKGYSTSFMPDQLAECVQKLELHFNPLLAGFTRIATENHSMIHIGSGLSALPPREYTVERLQISPGNLTILCATGCSGKTMLAQYIATCVSSAKPLFGQFDVKKGGVVHVDGEQSKQQTEKRYIRIANGLDVTEVDVRRVTLKYRLDAPEVQQQAVEAEFVSLCTGKALCIVDSLKAVTCADENSGDIDTVLKMFKRVAEKTHCAVLVIHHKGKGKDSKQSGRGHSSIYDSADVQFDLDCNNEVYEITCAKTRDDRYFDGIRYQLSDDGAYNVAQRCSEQLNFCLLSADVKSARQTQREKIAEALTGNGELKHNDLFAMVKGDRKKFTEVLGAMIDAHEVSEATGPRNSKIYSLVQA